MSILIDENTKLIVQGITGREGSYHTEQMLKYGTKVVGVDPAVASGPLITTINDLVAIVVYYGLVAVVLIDIVHLV